MELLKITNLHVRVDEREILHGLSLTGYLQLVDWSNSLVRPGKSRLKEEVPPILAQLWIEVDGW